MLDAMRRGVANLFAKLLLGLLVVAFAVWGVNDYLGRGPAQGGPLATVGKTQITVDDFKQAYQQEVQALGRKLGRSLTPEQAKLLGVWRFAIQRLTGSAAIDLHARELGVTASDAIVGAIIRGQHPEIIDSKGRIDGNKYSQVIRQAGFRSVGEYEVARRRDLWREQLTETLGAGALPQQYLVDMLYRFRDETRVVEYIIPDFTKRIIPDFTKRITIAEPSEKQQQEFFDQNKARYVAPEERKATLLLLSRDEALSRAKVTDEEVKAAYDAAKDSFDVPEKRRVAQLTFPDKAAAEKAYAELSKAKDFNAAAAKLGFPAADIDLGLLTRAEMIDPKIAEAAFKLKANELSRPVEGQFSVVLLRIGGIEGGKKRTFEEAKGEIRERIAGERIGQQVQAVYDKVEAARAKGTPLKEIAAEIKLPFQEIAAINRTGKAPDGKDVIPHADAAKIAEAIFGATEGVETEVLELSDSGYSWFDLLGVTPERQRPFEEVAGKVKADFIAAERSKAMASLAAKEVERLKGGASMEAVAKSLGAKIERTAPIKRTTTPPPQGLTAVALQEAFKLPKGGGASAPTADGKSRAIFRVADIIAAPDPTPEQAAALKDDVAKQMRVDIMHQYVGGLQNRYGFSINEKELLQALGVQSGQPDLEGGN
jgi:peptidyl-prolyl cis-trans isomerase D